MKIKFIENRMSNAARRAAVETINKHLVPSSWECVGAGEIVMTLYISDREGRKICIGELCGDNGALFLYNQTGRPWTESLEDKSDKWLLDTLSIIAEETN